MKNKRMKLKQLCFVCLYYKYPLRLADSLKLSKKCLSLKHVLSGHCRFQSDKKWKNVLKTVDMTLVSALREHIGCWYYKPFFNNFLI